MAPTPTKPTNVDVNKLKSVLTQLQQIENNIQEGTPGSWDSIGNAQAMQQAFQGMQGSVAQQIGDYYGDVSYHVNKSWTAVQSGVTALIGMLTTTISEHSGADTSAQQGAHNVNTGGGGTSPGPESAG